MMFQLHIRMLMENIESVNDETIDLVFEIYTDYNRTVLINKLFKTGEY